MLIKSSVQSICRFLFCVVPHLGALGLLEARRTGMDTISKSDYVKMIPKRSLSQNIISS